MHRSRDGDGPWEALFLRGERDVLIYAFFSVPYDTATLLRK